MRLSPDELIFWEYGWITVNLTLVTTWVLMLLLVIGAWGITRNLKSDIKTTRWQSILEMLVIMIRDQIKDDTIPLTV